MWFTGSLLYASPWRMCLSRPKRRILVAEICNAVKTHCSAFCLWEHTHACVAVPLNKSGQAHDVVFFIFFPTWICRLSWYTGLQKQVWCFSGDSLHGYKNTKLARRWDSCIDAWVGLQRVRDDGLEKETAFLFLSSSHIFLRSAESTLCWRISAHISRKKGCYILFRSRIALFFLS